MLEGALLWHEPISPVRFLGAAVTLGGLMVVMSRRFSGDDPIKLEVTE
jgi:drug/metabolite transporter (DMT)-like permease